MSERMSERDRALQDYGVETMREFLQAESDSVETRLEYLREQIKQECISYGELAELQDLADQGLIPDHELELRQWAGIPEFPEDEELSPTSEYVNHNGKTVYRYEVEANSLEDALDQIPGDFLLLHWYANDRDNWALEIVRTF